MARIVINFFRGVFIGIANLIPGVSGGTIAVILGIYEKLIDSINDFLFNKKKRWGAFVFLAQIAFGAAVGIKGFSVLITYLIASYYEPTFYFFIGLIAGSVPMLYGLTFQKSKNPLYFLLLLISFALVLAIPKQFSEGMILNPNLVLSFTSFSKFFSSGFVAAGAMIVPGISGSFMLMLMGTYFAIVNAVKTFNIPILFSVAVGAITGLVFLTALIEFCLKKFTVACYFVILGLVLGSLFKIWPGITLHPIAIGVNILVLVLGIVTTYFLEQLNSLK